MHTAQMVVVCGVVVIVGLLCLNKGPTIGLSWFNCRASLAMEVVRILGPKGRMHMPPNSTSTKS